MFDTVSVVGVPKHAIAYSMKALPRKWRSFYPERLDIHNHTISGGAIDSISTVTFSLCGVWTVYLACYVVPPVSTAACVLEHRVLIYTQLVSA
jgi:hypothetical protein